MSGPLGGGIFFDSHCIYPVDYVETHLYNDPLLGSLLAAAHGKRFRWQRRAKDRSLALGRSI